DPDHPPAVIQRPCYEPSISVRRVIEPAVETVKRPGNRVATFVRLDLRIRPVSRQHRVERERHEERYEHCARDREGEGTEPLTRESLHETDGHEHRDDGERRCGDGEADLVRALV